MGNYQIHNKTQWVLKGMEQQINEVHSISMDSLDIDQTVLITIDVVNGFLKKGALSSERVYHTLKRWMAIHGQFEGYQKVFFKDAHQDDSIEFEVYPEHCVAGEWESEIVEELEVFIDHDAWIIQKNSTNGFLTHDFMSWLEEHPEIDCFVIIGDCTDLCIKQFALTLKTYFNENNTSSRIIVPIDATETFDLEATNHDGNLMNLFSYYEMMSNGIEIVKSVD